MLLFPDAVEQYINDPASNLNTAASRRTYWMNLRALQAFTPELEVDQFTEDVLVAYLTDTPRAPATIANLRTVFAGFFGWATYRGLTPSDPTTNLKRLFPGGKKPVRRHNWLTRAEVERVLQSTDLSTIVGRRDNVLLRLGFTAGLRREELRTVRWQDLDLPNRRLHLVGKGRKLATVAITDGTLDALLLWKDDCRANPNDPILCGVQRQMNWKTGEVTHKVKDGQPLGATTLAHAVRRAAERSGVRFLPHDMRRTFAGLVHDRSGIEVTSAALRHSNLGVTQRYLERRQDAAARAMEEAGIDF